MIYYSFSHLRSFYMLIFAGIIFSLVCSILKIVLIYNFSNKINKNIQLFFHTILGGLIYILFNNLFNYGEFIAVLLLTYISTFFILNKFTKKIVDFLSIKVYHCYIKLILKEKFYFARKIKSIED